MIAAPISPAILTWVRIMLLWLEHDSVALAILIFGIAAVELIAVSF